jgi:phage shock protein PspC (stress-responsive transcriptional regulator)
VAMMGEGIAEKNQFGKQLLNVLWVTIILLCPYLYTFYFNLTDASITYPTLQLRSGVFIFIG